MIVILEEQLLAKSLKRQIVKNFAITESKIFLAKTTEEVEKILAENQIDLLIIGNLVPGFKSGLQLSIEAQKKYPNLNIIITSSTLYESLVPTGVILIEKPFKYDKLLKIFNKVLAN